MEKIQLCFRIGGKEHDEEVKEGILKIKNELDSELGSGNYKIVSCHLNKEIVEAKGFDPTMINFLHDTFGDDYINLCTSKTFEEAMQNMQAYRVGAATAVDRLYIVKEEIGNISLELELFTNHKVKVY